MKKINFFIVGAPKSATSFIKYYLNQHPKIFLPEDEPVFMCKDMRDLSQFKTLDDYLELFKDRLEENSKIVCGEKTSIYLFSENAYKEIYKYNPNAKIIICLRNPIEACYSYHNHNKIMGFEQINDFLDAWNVQDKRKLSNYKIPFFARKEKLRYQYKYNYTYSIHVTKFIKMFGEKNVKILLHDDILKNSEKVFSELFSFLDVDDYKISKFETINKQPKVDIKDNLKNKIFAYKVFFLKKNIVKKYSKIIKKVFKIESFLFLRRFLKTKNDTLEYENNNKIDNKKEKYNKILIDSFRDSIKDLSKILNKNLDHWIQ